MTDLQPQPRTLKTKAGTELPMLDLKGKPYLQVAHRLVWFREEHPTWGIETEALTLENEMNRAIFRATIKNEDGRIIATATGHETLKDFPDFIEKAETKAVGRALAMCGYGTQFAPELDEGSRIVDSPTTPAKFAPRPVTPATKPADVKKFSESLPEQPPAPKPPVSRVGKAIQTAMQEPRTPSHP